jgi:hypothetical protein
VAAAAAATLAAAGSGWGPPAEQQLTLHRHLPGCTHVGPTALVSLGWLSCMMLLSLLRMPPQPSSRRGAQLRSGVSSSSHVCVCVGGGNGGATCNHIASSHRRPAVFLHWQCRSDPRAQSESP